MPIDDQPVDGGNLGGTGVHTGLAQRVSDDPQPNRLWLTCNTFDADPQGRCHGPNRWYRLQHRLVAYRSIPLPTMPAGQLP